MGFSITKQLLLWVMPQRRTTRHFCPPPSSVCAYISILLLWGLYAKVCSIWPNIFMLVKWYRHRQCTIELMQIQYNCSTAIAIAKEMTRCSSVVCCFALCLHGLFCPCRTGTQCCSTAALTSTWKTWCRGHVASLLNQTFRYSTLELVRPVHLNWTNLYGVNFYGFQFCSCLTIQWTCRSICCAPQTARKSICWGKHSSLTPNISDFNFGLLTHWSQFSTQEPL